LVCQDNLASGVVLVKGKDFFGCGSMLGQWSGGSLQVNVRIAYIHESHNTLHLLCDSTSKNVLFLGREMDKEEEDKFHHKVCCVPKCSTLKGFVDEVDGNTLMFLGNSTWTAFTIWCLGWAEAVALVEGPLAEGREALSILMPSQIFLNWKPRAMMGPLGLSQCKMPSRISMRC